MKPLSCVLYCQQGTSDKEYRLQLHQVGDGWNVTAQYGRRGGNLTTDQKMVNGDYQEALKSYERVKREKLGKGYHEVSNCTNCTDVTSVTSVASVASVAEPKVEVELLTPIEAHDIGRFVVNDRYWFQEKADGDRSPVRRDGDTFIRYNRKGEAKPLLAALAKELRDLPGDWLLDGEIEGERLWIFSALESNGEDLRNRPFAVRYDKAVEILDGFDSERITLLPVWTTADEKQNAVVRLARENAEGVVIVDSHAPFRPGRAGQHFKLKFVATATVRVLRPNVQGKRSVDIELRNGGPAWIPFGSVSIPDKYGELPAPGILIEVRYLYAHRGEGCGALNQPVYLRVRDDLDDSAATTDQLKFKRGEI